ncbi:hypothetical protein Dimus_003866 [Dionaea muscipula]
MMLADELGVGLSDAATSGFRRAAPLPNVVAASRGTKGMEATTPQFNELFFTIRERKCFKLYETVGYLERLNLCGN